MTTVQEIFDTAVHLMDEQNETSGATETQDTRTYKVRTISILNAVMPNLYPYSDTWSVGQAGKRPACPKLKNDKFNNPDFSQEIPLDDSLAMGVLPYALAAHLLATENEDLSSFFLSKYTSALMELREKTLSSWETITSPYGLF